MKVLVVEDDDVFLIKVYQAKLTKAGFEVKIAADGEEVGKIMQTFIPDVILLDLIMPKMDGFAVLSQLKSRDQYKHIPVIITSNLSQLEDKQKALDMGAVEYLVKSDISIQAVVDKLKSYLKK